MPPENGLNAPSGYVYDAETELYYLQSRYYNSEVGRFINADALVSTGQGLLGNNMFAYCRNNPVCRRDISGTSEEQILDCTPNLDEDKHDGKSSTGSKTQIAVGTVGGTNGGGTGGASSKALVITTTPNGIASLPNPNNESMEKHHNVEKCQIRKSNFARVDIQGNSNLIYVPYSLHRWISGYYSSKPENMGGLRVRDALAGTSFEYQTQFGWAELVRGWEIVYGE